MSERSNQRFKQVAQRLGRYLFAAGAGILFAYIAWAPHPPPGAIDPVTEPAALPPSMLEGLRERGVLAPDATTIPPPETPVMQEASALPRSSEGLAIKDSMVDSGVRPDSDLQVWTKTAASRPQIIDQSRGPPA